MDLVPPLERTFQHARTVIAGVRPEQYGDATPCEEWCVRDLLSHMIGVVGGMGAAMSEATPAVGHPGDSGDSRKAFELSPDPAAQFEAAAAATLAAWRSPGAMERVVDAGGGAMPGRVLASINLIDTATHTWDLATATGQPARLPDDVAAAVLEVSLQTISLQLRPGRFGPEQEAPPGADPTERLAAFLGRKP